MPIVGSCLPVVARVFRVFRESLDQLLDDN